MVDVAFGFDANYAPHAAAVIASVVRYAPNARFRFVLLHDGVDASVQKQVESIGPNHVFCWREVGDDDVPAFEARRHLTRSTLYRLGLERLAPADCVRIIYLDADITVIGDVSELWRQDLDGKTIGAVVDSYMKLDGLDAPFFERWGLPKAEYFNAGILLIDLKRVRDAQSFSKAIRFVAEHDHDLPFNDQDALNWTFWDDWRPLSVEWNVQRPQAAFWDASRLPTALALGDKQPKIVHFTGTQKPWLRKTYHPWSWIYWESLMHTPFFDRIAREQGMSRLDRVRLWTRWMRRRPRAARVHDMAPLAFLR